MRHILLPCVFLLAYGGHACAEVYTWTDENGVTHFSDQSGDQSATPVELRAPSIIPMRENIEVKQRLLQQRQKPSEDAPTTAVQLGEDLGINTLDPGTPESEEGPADLRSKVMKMLQHMSGFVVD